MQKHVHVTSAFLCGRPVGRIARRIARPSVRLSVCLFRTGS